jgi:alpha-glucosidase
LGQAFNFDLLASKWDADSFLKIITDNLEMSAKTGSSSTWVMSNHDVIRHATRLAIPGYGESADGFGDEHRWYVENRLNPNLDLDLGLARAKAATLLILALPGSTYIYQGEELGLHEVLDIPGESMQDPQWFRGEGKLKSRDGCRVPLPWTSAGSSYGFGKGGAHLPQPSWFAQVNVESQEAEDSTLNLYREAIALRKASFSTDSLKWLNFGPNATAFERDGMVCVTNFGKEGLELPSGKVLLSSGAISDGKLPGNATAWVSTL